MIMIPWDAKMLRWSLWHWILRGILLLWTCPPNFFLFFFLWLMIILSLLRMNTVFDNSGKCEQGDGHYALLGDCQRSGYHKRSLHRRHHHHHRHNDYCHHWQICFVSQWATDSLQMWIHPFLWLHPPGYDHHDDVLKCHKSLTKISHQTLWVRRDSPLRPRLGGQAGLGRAMVVKMIIMMLNNARLYYDNNLLF